MSKIREVSGMLHNLRNLEDKTIDGWRYLSMSSKATKGILPAFVQVMSHHTGRIVRFIPINPGHPKFDQDQWDGEQMVYFPDNDDYVNGNLLLVVYHG